MLVPLEPDEEYNKRIVPREKTVYASWSLFFSIDVKLERSQSQVGLLTVYEDQMSGISMVDHGHILLLHALRIRVAPTDSVVCPSWLMGDSCCPALPEEKEEEDANGEHPKAAQNANGNCQLVNGAESIVYEAQKDGR